MYVGSVYICLKYCADTKCHFPSFKPHILPESEAIVSRTGWAKTPVEKRLVKSRPCKSDQSSTISSSRSIDMSRSFLSRLGEYETSRCMNASIRREIANQECSFQPRINSDRLPPISIDRGTDLFYRLAVSDPKQREARRTFREEFETCRFTPQIDPYSEILVASRRLLDPGYCATKRVTEVAQLPATPPRKRRVNAKYAHVKGKYDFKNPEQILMVYDQKRMAKQALSAQAKWEREQDELAECTFQPRVGHGRIRPRQGPILIPGLNRFLQNRKQPTTNPLSSRKSHGLLTVPSPFVLGS